MATIEKTDVQFMESKTMNDTPDGGGQMTARQIQDGETGNVWPDISRLDRTTGALEMRKIYLAVRAANSERYSGAHVIMDSVPQDPRVNMFLMNLGDHYDTRDAARNSIESFTVKAGRSPLELNGNHLEGQTDIDCWLTLDAEDPKIGDTIALVQGSAEQYLKIKTLSIVEKTFTYLAGSAYATFDAKAARIGLSAPLSHGFGAGVASPVVDNATMILKTQPAPGVEYYAARPLAQEITAGDSSLKVDTIQQQLLPVATQEVPMIDLTVGNGSLIRPLEGVEITLPINTKAGKGVWLLPRAAAPGTIKVYMQGSNYRESGRQLIRDSGTDRFNEVPEVDFFAGKVSFDAMGSYTGTITYTPAQSEKSSVFTTAQDVTELTRGTNWTFSLSPPPSPGSVKINYLYGEDWIELNDNGAGGLVGTGSGTVSYETGSVLISTAGLPEIDSQILASWSEKEGVSAVMAAPQTVELSFNITESLGNGAIDISWIAGGVEKSISRPDHATGFSGNGSARFVPNATGTEVFFSPDTLADDSEYTASYDHFELERKQSVVNSAQVPYTATQTELNLDLPEAFEPNATSFSLKVCLAHRTENRFFEGEVKVSESQHYSYMHCYERDGLIHNYRHTSSPVGTADPATGQIRIDLTKILGVYSDRVRIQTEDNKWSDLVPVGGWRRMTVVAQPCVIKYAAPGIVNTNKAKTVVPSMTGVLANTAVERGTSVFKVGEDFYFDDSRGRIFKGWNTETGAGEVVGSMSYAYNETAININNPTGASLTMTPVGGLANLGLKSPPQRHAYFFLPKSPIRPGTVQVVFDNFEGDKIVLKAESDGTLVESERISSGYVVGNSAPFSPSYPLDSNCWIGVSRTGQSTVDSASPGSYGKLDFATGLMFINFRDGVVSEEVRVNAVQALSVPLDGDIIGVDPVRMPSNGMVPVYKAGNTLVIHHTDALNVDTPTAGAVHSVARTDLAELYIEDSQGVELDPSMYAADLTAGTVTLADPLTLQNTESQALAPPLSVVHRIDAMALCSDTSLDGTLTLALPLEKDFPLGTVVSSAVTIGDLQARISRLFSQATDPGLFQDEPNGDPTNTRLNDLEYPIEMDSRGTVKDRWKIKFTGATTYQLYSERRGSVAAGSTVEDLSPVNPSEGVPYFTIRKEAFGVAGWQSGNTIRFDTEPAAHPLWQVRAIQPGPASETKDSVSLQGRGDTDQ